MSTPLAALVDSFARAADISSRHAKRDAIAAVPRDASTDGDAHAGGLA